MLRLAPLIAFAASAALAFGAEYVVIVDSVPLYEVSHFKEDDRIIDWLEYRTQVVAEPSWNVRGHLDEFCIVSLKDGRMCVMATGSFGHILEIIKDGVTLYAEPGGAELLTLNRGDRVGNPEYFTRGQPITSWLKVKTRVGVDGWVRHDAVKYVPPTGKLKTLSEEGPDNSVQGAR